MTFTPNFNTPEGVRAVAEHLDSLADDPNVTSSDWRERHVIGHLHIFRDPYVFRKTAELLRKNASYRPSRYQGGMETNVLKMDAVRHCGSPEAALETIRRQLAIQGADMDPAAVKRCERAAQLIEAHIAEEARKAEREAWNDAILARINAGTAPGMQDILPEGTQVKVTHTYRDYLATVSAGKIGPHPILGAKHRVALHTVTLTHIKETRGKVYNFYPVSAKTIKRLIWNQITILPVS